MATLLFDPSMSVELQKPQMPDSSPAHRERELGLDRGETGSSHPPNESGAATVIEVRTRGTLRSDCCYMLSIEKLMLRRYHVLDYIFTRPSWNLCWLSDASHNSRGDQ